ncbi:hypothetical protein BH10ACI4_BH10ACI4_08330 [soil metagenome]
MLRSMLKVTQAINNAISQPQLALFRETARMTARIISISITTQGGT